MPRGSQVTGTQLGNDYYIIAGLPVFRLRIHNIQFNKKEKWKQS